MADGDIPISGTCDPAFEEVREALASTLALDGEIGQAVSVLMDGEQVVDLWGGYKDIDRGEPWDRDTIVCMMSTGKAVGAICVLALADRGQIDLNAPVAEYWPEFGQAGKEKITVRQVLAHLAGIPFIDAAPKNSMFDWDTIIKAIEIQQPTWEPGSTPGYHSFAIGYLNGELVRRVSGKRVSDFWRDEFSGPLGIDFNFSLNDDEMSRCVDFHTDDGDPFFETVRDIGNPLGRSWAALPDGEDFNSRELRVAGIPDYGHGNARGLATIYGLLCSGTAILSPEMVAEARAEVWNATDAILQAPLRHGLGFILSCDTLPMTGNPDCFGGVGAGGAIGFADPDAKLAFAFCGNHAVREDRVALEEQPANRVITAVKACL